ncbi:SH3 domain-containing protein [Streptomyces decoyicus]|uniref:SH3 domain-containing protein n=1 Tax=Streptomyces decoyicus TaxID=249567 RepID=UPI000ABFA08A|nr:SH3 domain-containing protein [Streptomyces decoyicus]QZY15513.1 SH3 domain-containing protein [Streptomyces decoyicus]
MKLKKALVSIAATTAALGGFTIGGATPASAAGYGCGSVGHNNSDAVHKVVVGDMLNGPSASCRQIRSVARGTTFYAWCGVYNKHGNLWVYGRTSDDSTGWIYSQDLTKESGSVKIC